jgi:hypothetical protein
LKQRVVGEATLWTPISAERQTVDGESVME